MKYSITVFLDVPKTYKYEVETATKAKEHAAAIIKGGYSHDDGKKIEFYPPHRISMVRISEANA